MFKAATYRKDKKLKLENTYICVAAEDSRVDVDVGGRGLRLPDRPSGVDLLGALVQVQEGRGTEDVRPGAPELEERRSALLDGVLEDVAEDGSDVAPEQPLVGIRMIFDDGVHQIKDRQLQVRVGNL